MSYKYDQYLNNHKKNVGRGLAWLQNTLPELLEEDFDYEWVFNVCHDFSKDLKDEYEAYDAYFYGGNRSFKVVEEFNRAWLNHIHRNTHHWQHWILLNDDPKDGTIILDMPEHSIIEMVCDWWSFGWESGNLNEIFKWYDERKNYIQLSPNTRKKVEDILDKMREKLGYA